MASMSGTSITFGIVAESFESLGYSTSDIALISVFNNVGQFSGVVGGYFIDNHGPTKASYVSGCCFFFGYLLLWLQVTDYIPSSLGSLCLTMLVAQIGLSCVAQISCATAMLAFPVDLSPSVAGLAKAYYAFGGSVFACIASAYFYNAEKAYILFVSLTVSLVVPALGQLLNFLPDEIMTNMEYEEKRNIDTTLTYNFYHAMALFTCILLYVILRLSEVSHVILGIFAAIVVVCALSILLVPFLKKNVYIHVPCKDGDEITKVVESPLHHDEEFENGNAPDKKESMETELISLSKENGSGTVQDEYAEGAGVSKDLSVCFVEIKFMEIILLPLTLLCRLWK